MIAKLPIKQARAFLKSCKEQGIMIVTAESCTGGMLASLLTEIPGSSAVFDRGFVTYSNEAKQSLLGVSPTTLKKFGAVSAEVAKAMAEGALKNSKAQLGISVTGVAGPGGGTKTKPVGLVYIAVAVKKNKTVVEEHHFKGGRQEVRLSAVASALQLALK